MNGTHAWSEILIAVQDALRQAESEAIHFQIVEATL